MILQLLFVFCATCLVDYFWTQCILAISKRSALSAAALSSAIILLNSSVVVVYVGNRWAIGAASVGGFLGTYLAVRRAA